MVSSTNLLLFSSLFHTVFVFLLIFLFFCCVALTLHFFLRTANPSWWQILWSTFKWLSLLFHIWISCFELTICTFAVVKKRIWPVDIIKTWYSPKPYSPSHPNYVAGFVTDTRTRTFLKQTEMRRNDTRRTQTKWKLCKQNSHELQLSVRNVKNIFLHKIVPKA